MVYIASSDILNNLLILSVIIKTQTQDLNDPVNGNMVTVGQKDMS